MTFSEAVAIRNDPDHPLDHNSQEITSRIRLWDHSNQEALRRGVNRNQGPVVGRYFDNDPAVEERIFTNDEAGPLGDRVIFQEQYGQKPSAIIVSSIFARRDAEGPSNNLFETLLLVDAYKELGADVTLICPYVPYTRADHKVDPNSRKVEPIAVRLVADMLKVAGADRFCFVDPHSDALVHSLTTGKDGKPAVAVTALPYLAKQATPSDIDLGLGPDKGRGSISRDIAESLGLRLVSLNKYRDPATGRVSFEKLSPEIAASLKGKRAVTFDDVISTASTLREIAQLTGEAGLLSIDVIATHGDLCSNNVNPAKDVVTNLSHTVIRKVTISDSRPSKTELSRLPKVQVVSLKPFVDSFVGRLQSDPCFNPYRDHDFSGYLCR